MFETVAPETYLPRSRKVFYETLPVSIALHAAVAVAIVLAGSWTVVFPVHTPRLLITMYNTEALPTPPPPPPPPPAPLARQSAPTTTVKQMQPAFVEDLAPTVIPEQIPLVMPEPEIPVAAPTGDPDGSVMGFEGGVSGGEIGGVAGGQVGGKIGGEIGGVVPPDTIIVGRDLPLPTAPMSMTYPQYPEEGRLRRYEDTLVVRYVIGKDGRVREVTVLDPAERPMFQDAAVRAIRGWRFRPVKKDGVAQEVIHELTVYFRLTT